MERDSSFELNQEIRKKKKQEYEQLMLNSSYDDDYKRKNIKTGKSQHQDLARQKSYKRSEELKMNTGSSGGTLLKDQSANNLS